MANEQEKFGLPQVLIDFKTKSVSAIPSFCARYCCFDFKDRNNRHH